MGNCQAAGDAVGVTVEHPDGKVERLYWSVAARQVMLQYPGHYVALVPPRIPTSRKSEVPFPPSNQMKLLPPHGMLQVGQHYRLISFEDVLLEMSEKKRFGGRSSSGGSRSKRVHSEHLSCGVDDDEENMEPVPGFLSCRMPTKMMEKKSLVRNSRAELLTPCVPLADLANGGRHSRASQKSDDNS
ncbi:hypothetical protein AXG93_3825s1210 [Marchantia polymorpha subsp. ruderalis]|uniref:DUF4228 domain-containing protein n=1 Tax=Marchantia polymorpha subsp. ruderalis TaxID=1480154 RepID=A0A176W9J7_MARPO|nr:hypothetical protein AXG93_3825s1210 [Marchantia polymorpha subsp. ruderalis]